MSIVVHSDPNERHERQREREKFPMTIYIKRICILFEVRLSSCLELWLNITAHHSLKFRRPAFRRVQRRYDMIYYDMVSCDLHSWETWSDWWFYMVYMRTCPLVRLSRRSVGSTICVAERERDALILKDSLGLTFSMFVCSLSPHCLQHSSVMPVCECLKLCQYRIYCLGEWIFTLYISLIHGYGYVDPSWVHSSEE
jgi:hypothetical protein